MGESGLEFTLEIDFLELEKEKLASIEELFKKQGFASIGYLNLKGEFSTEGKLKLFTESSAEINYGIKSVASTKVAGMHFQHGIEFDLTSMSLDLFHTTGGYAIFWEAEKTERLMGHDEVELNIAAEVTLGDVTVAIKHKPQPSHMGTTPTQGMQASKRTSEIATVNHLLIHSRNRDKRRIQQEAALKKQRKIERIDSLRNSFGRRR